jgi:hypothetical protein
MRKETKFIKDLIKDTSEWIKTPEGKKAMKEAAERGTPVTDRLRKASSPPISNFTPEQWEELEEWFSEKADEIIKRAKPKRYA